MSTFPIIDHRIKNIALFSGIYLALVSLFAYIIFILINSTGTRTEFDGAIGADFLAFYTGGTFYNLGILEQAYNLAPDFHFPQQAEFQKSLIGEDLKKFNYFINPPYAALIYAPFAKLSYLPAFILWQIFNFCLLVLSVIIARRELTILQKLPIHKVVGCCFLFYPTLGWVIYGQATPIVLLLYCLCFTSLRKRQEYRAGIYLGLLAFKPQLAIVIALVLLFKWRWRSLIGGGLSVSMSLALGYILAPDAMLAYIEISPQLIDLLRLPNYPTWGVHSFFGFSVLLFEELNPLFAILSTYVLSGGTILLLWQLWKNIAWIDDLKAWDLAMAITFIWGLLISPHLYYYDLMLLLLPGAIVINLLPWLIAQDPRMLLWASITWVICFFGSFLSLAQTTYFNQLELPVISLQITTPIVFYWGFRLFEVSRKGIYSIQHNDYLPERLVS